MTRESDRNVNFPYVFCSHLFKNGLPFLLCNWETFLCKVATGLLKVEWWGTGEERGARDLPKKTQKKKHATHLEKGGIMGRGPKRDGGPCKWVKRWGPCQRIKRKRGPSTWVIIKHFQHCLEYFSLHRSRGGKVNPPEVSNTGWESPPDLSLQPLKECSAHQPPVAVVREGGGGEEEGSIISPWTKRGSGSLKPWVIERVPERESNDKNILQGQSSS